MKNIIKQTVCIAALLSVSSSAFAWHWLDLWKTRDQQAAGFLKAGKAAEAAKLFRNKDWQSVALYRSGNYSQAFQQFRQQQTSDNQYNAGNAAAFAAHYLEAITAYDKAIALNAKNTDAIANREIIKKIMKQQQESQKNNPAKDNKKENNSQAAQNKQNQSLQTNDKSDNKNQQADQKNSASAKQQNSANQQSSQQATHADKNGEAQKQNAQQQNASAANSTKAQDENGKQLLRRIADDPGGLLRQKFLRDYLRRHPDENGEQG